jgi:hypothetical protein
LRKAVPSKGSNGYGVAGVGGRRRRRERGSILRKLANGF